MGREVGINLKERIGRLTIIKNDFFKKDKKHFYFKCKCDCGTEKYISQDALKSGFTSSCGCFKLEKLRKTLRTKALKGRNIKFMAFNRIYHDYIRSSKDRGIYFDIDKNYFFSLLEGNCFYCGVIPSSERKDRITKEIVKYNGIDRVDSSIGYIRDNCVSCCTFCNRIKREKSVKDFVSHIKKILINLGEI